MADWEAMQTVLLAFKIVLDGATLKHWRRDKTVFGQLVHMIEGSQEQIMTADGNPGKSAEVKRLYAAIERVKAGDLPAYNRVKLPDIPAE
jgi:hypothetical protein